MPTGILTNTHEYVYRCVGYACLQNLQALIYVLLFFRGQNNTKQDGDFDDSDDEVYSTAKRIDQEGPLEMP